MLGTTSTPAAADQTLGVGLTVPVVAARDVGHRVAPTVGHVAGQPRVGEDPGHRITPLLQLRCGIPHARLEHARVEYRPLQRRGGATGGRDVDPAEHARDLRGGAQVADTPAAERVALREAADDDAALGQRGDVRDRKVLTSVEGEPGVHLVADDRDIPFLAQLGDELQLVLAEHMPGRIMRRVHQDGLCAGTEDALERFRVETPVRCFELDETRHGTGQGKGSEEIVVIRFEDDDLVAGIQYRKQRGEQCLGTAHGDRHLGGGIGGCGETRRDLRPKFRVARRVFVLIDTSPQGGAGGLDEPLVGRRGGRHAGREVDGSGRDPPPSSETRPPAGTFPTRSAKDLLA